MQPTNTEMIASMACFFLYYSLWQVKLSIQTISSKERIRYETKKDLVLLTNKWFKRKDAYIIDDASFARWSQPIFIKDELHKGLLICYEGANIIELSTNNLNEVGLRKLLPMTVFAKLIKSEEKSDYKDNPNGKMVRCGSVSLQKWDVSKLWDNKD